MNRKAFYDGARKGLFGGKMTAGQVEGTEAILNEWERRALTGYPKLAYILATAFHETAHTMQPVEEYGKGRGKDYGRRDPKTGKAYYGRGHVQLTWYRNYKLFGELLNLPLLYRPELALEMGVSIQVLFEGMLRGLYTGKKLADYITEEKKDYVGARRIVNGIDKAELIAGYAKRFEAALDA